MPDRPPLKWPDPSLSEPQRKIRIPPYRTELRVIQPDGSGIFFDYLGDGPIRSGAKPPNGRPGFGFFGFGRGTSGGGPGGFPGGRRGGFWGGRVGVFILVSSGSEVRDQPVVAIAPLEHREPVLMDPRPVVLLELERHEQELLLPVAQVRKPRDPLQNPAAVLPGLPTSR